MKILFFSFSQQKINGGGAAVAISRLAQALTSTGLNCKIYTKENFGTIHDKDNFEPIDSTSAFKFTLFSKQDMNLIIEKEEPDIVFLNSLEVNSWSLFDVIKIKKPIIWFSHDNFLHTGGCLYILEDTPYECKKYITKCGACPVIRSNREFDISTLQFDIKAKIYPLLKNTTFIAPSEWLKQKMQESALLKNHTTLVIPNTLNTEVFKPCAKKISREALGFPLDKKIILFTGTAIYDFRKGFHYFQQTIESLAIDPEQIFILALGHSNVGPLKIGKHIIHCLGFVQKESQQVQIYNSADVVVVPSLSESFGLTASEALSCGVPVVAFNTSGLRDIIDHKINGYLAKPFDVKDLKYGIHWVLQHPNKDELAKSARQKALLKFSYPAVVSKYIDLFNQVILNDNNAVDQKTQQEIYQLREKTYSLMEFVDKQINAAAYKQNPNINNPWTHFGQLNAQDKIIFLLKKTKNKIKNDGLVLTSKNILKYSKYVAKKIFKI